MGLGTAFAEDSIKFKRASTAYDHDGVLYAEDEYITRDFIIASKPVIAADDSHPPHASNFFNACETTNYLWGIYGYQLYKKVKSGGNWTAVTGVTGGCAWSDSGQRLVILNGQSSGKYTKDEGQTWNAVQTMPVWSNNVSNPYQSRWAAWKGDIVCLGEYDASGYYTGKKIWRSTDAGANWTTELDTEFKGHFHALGYHAATNKWVAFRGDGLMKQVWTSVDNGETWQQVTFDCGIPQDQPMSAIDYGDPRYLLCGSDQYGGVFKYDMIDDKFVSCSTEYILLRASQEAEPYCMYLHNEVLYVFPYDSSNQTYHRGVIYISTDYGATFSPWYQFYNGPAGNAEQRGVRFLSGLAQGKVYCNFQIDGVGRTNNTVQLPAKTAKRTFVLVEAAIDNKWEDDNVSHFINNADAFTVFNNSTKTYQNSGGLIGDKKSVNFTKAVPTDNVSGGHRITAGSENIDGTRYFGRIYVKGDTGPIFLITNLCHYLGAYAGNNYLYGLYDSEYVEVLVATDKMYGLGSTNKSFSMTCSAGSASATYPSGSIWDVTFGGVVLNINRGHFTPGTTDTAKTSLARQFVVGNNWTVLETIIPDLPVECYYQYALWDASLNYGQNCWVYYDSDGDGETECWYSSAGDPSVGDVPGTDPDWVQVESWKWHVLTLDAGDGHRIVCYLDTTPYLSGGSELDGRKFKADIYTGGTYQETISITNPCAFLRFAQLDFGFTMKDADKNIRFYFRDNTGVIQEYVSTGIYPEFKNKTLTLKYETTTSNQMSTEVEMPQMCQWVLPHNNKQFAAAYSSSEIDTEMDNVLFAGPPRVISGYILGPDGSTPVAGVTISSDGEPNAVTDADGYYELAVEYAWSGTITPSKPDYTFNPAYIDYVHVLEDRCDDYLAVHYADINADGFIDENDLALMSEYWLSIDAPFGNLNKDNIVNLHDFAEFSRFYKTE